MIVRYEKAGVIGLLDNAGHLILAQVRLNEQTMREKTKVSDQKGGKKKRQNDNFQLQSQKDKKQKRRYVLTVFIIISPIKLLKRVLVVFIIVLKWPFQLFGLLLFGEVPGVLKVIGVCLVFASIVSIAVRDVFLSKWKRTKADE